MEEYKNQFSLPSVSGVPSDEEKLKIAKQYHHVEKKLDSWLEEDIVEAWINGFNHMLSLLAKKEKSMVKRIIYDDVMNDCRQLTEQISSLQSELEVVKKENEGLKRTIDFNKLK